MGALISQDSTQAIIFRLAAIGAYSQDAEHRPTFVVRRNPGFGWVINVLWPDREAEVIKRFTNEKEAAEWVAKHSESWKIIND
jgi:hypothetical protein